MLPLLVHIRPFDIVAATPTDIRLASGPAADIYGLGGLSWAPALIRRPTWSIEMMSVDIDGRVQAGKASFSVNLRGIPNFDFSRLLRWSGSAVAIYGAAEMTYATRTTEFIGFITSATLDPESLILSVDAQVSTHLLEKPLLYLEFSGAGGAAGDPSQKGTYKPAGFGSEENIEPVWFDQTNWVGMIDGYGNTISISALMEGASSMGASFGNYANYAALVAAAIPPGRWGTCIAEGMVRLGAPPAYPIGVNAIFGSGLVGSMMNRMISVHAGVPGANIDTAAFTALDVSVPYGARYWTKEQVTVREIIERLAASANATPLMNFQEKITVSRAVTSAAIATLNRSGQQVPRVVSWWSAPTFPPYWKLRARAARPANVLSFDQVLYEDDIEFRGRWSVSVVYRQGQTVDLADQSTWLYINATPTAGNAPPTWPTTSNAWWSNLTPPAAASDIKYASGATLESLKPGEAGANVTETRTAAAIIGQGSGATSNNLTQLNATEGAKLTGIALNAGTTLVLTSIGSIAATIAGNSAIRTSGSGNWNCCVRGPALRGTAYIAASVTNTGYTIVTLDSDATRYASGSPFDWNVQYDGATTLYVVNAGSIVATITVSSFAGGLLEMWYDGVNVKVVTTDTAGATSLRYTSPALASGLVFYPKWHLYRADLHTNLFAAFYSENNFATVGGGTRPSDYAGTTLNLTVLGTGITITGNSVTAGAGIAGYNDGVVTKNALRLGCYGEWLAPTSAAAHMVIGLSTDQVASTNNLDAWIAFNSGNFISKDNSNPADQVNFTSHGAFTASTDLFGIFYDGPFIHYFRNGALVRSIAATPGKTYYLKAFWNSQHTVNSFRFEPAANVSWVDLSGAGKPADYATADLRLTSIGSRSANVVGNTITSTTTAADYECTARADPLIGAQYAEMDIPATTHAVISFDTEATGVDYSVQRLYASYTPSTGNCQMWQDGVSRLSTTLATGLTGKFGLLYDGTDYRLFVAGVERGSPVAAHAANLTLYPKWSIFNASATITGLRQMPANDTNWDRVRGALRPANNAGTTLKLTALGSAVAGTHLVGNSLGRTDAGGDYTICAVGPAFSNTIVASCTVSGVTNWTIIAIDDDATTTALATQRFEFQFNNTTGAWYVIENGTTTWSGSVGANVNAGQPVRIIYDGVNVEFWISTSKVKSIASSAGLSFFPKWWQYNGADRTYDLNATPFSTNDYSSVSGAITGQGALATLSTVDTPQIVANAATLMSSAFSSGSVGILSVINTWYDLQTVTITSPTGQPIQIHAAAKIFSHLSPVLVTWRIYRDQSGNTAQLYDEDQGDSNLAYFKGTAALSDQPTAGVSVTYRFQCQRTSGPAGPSSGSSATRRNLMALESKR